MQSPSDVVVSAWIGLIRAERAVRTRVETDLKGAGFPSLSWYDVLLELKRAPDGCLTPRDLEHEMLFEQYNLSRLLDRMEAEGLVQRQQCPSDRRGWHAVITSAGRSQLRSAAPVHLRGVERHFGRHLSDEEADLLADVLGRVLGELRPDSPLVPRVCEPATAKTN